MWFNIKASSSIGFLEIRLGSWAMGLAIVLGLILVKNWFPDFNKDFRFSWLEFTAIIQIRLNSHLPTDFTISIMIIHHPIPWNLTRFRLQFTKWLFHIYSYSAVWAVWQWVKLFQHCSAGTLMGRGTLFVGLLWCRDDVMLVEPRSHVVRFNSLSWALPFKPITTIKLGWEGVKTFTFCHQ